TTAPRLSSIAATVDLPDPIPPVRPTSSTGLLRATLAPLQVLQDGLERDLLLTLLLGRQLGCWSGRGLPGWRRLGRRGGLGGCRLRYSKERRLRRSALRSDQIGLRGGGHRLAFRGQHLGLLLDLDGRRRRRGTHLAHRQGDPAPGDVHLDDLHPDLVAHRQDGLRGIDVLVRELADVHQPLDPRRHAHERAEGHELGDLALDDLAGLVLALELLPGVLLSGLQRERDPLALEVDVEDLHLDLLADLDDLARMVDVLPRELRHVHQAVDPAEVHERAEVHDRGDRALAALALVQGFEELLAPLALGLLEEGPAGEYDVVAVAVELDDLGLELLSDERVEVAHPAEIHERGRQEPAQADVEDQPALDDLDHGALDRAARLHDLLDPPPRPLVLRALLGQDEAPLLVLLLQDEGLDVVADLHDLARVDVVADRELLGGDHALRLVADVEEDLVPVDLDDRPLDDVAVLEVAERGLHGLDQLLRRQVALRRGLGIARVYVNHLLPRTRRAPGGWDVPWCECSRAAGES